MKTNSTFSRFVIIFTIYLLLTTALIQKSISVIPEEQQDQRNIIAIGKKLTTLDDVRLGDYSIKKDDPISSIAHDELRLLLTLFLDFNKQPHDASASLENLVRISKDVLPTLNKRTADEQIVWNNADQLLLDEQIESRYDELIHFVNSKEQKAMLTYIRAQYLFTNKRTNEGIATLRTVVKDFPGTAYELRANGELVFRLFLNKKYEESLELGTDIMKRNPNTKESQDALYFRARSRYQLKQYQEAKPSYDDFIKKYPTNKWVESAKYFQAKTNSSLGNNESALQQFSDFIKEYPKSTYRDDARQMMTNIYSTKQEYEKAMAMFELYKSENPDILEQMAAEKHIRRYIHGVRVSQQKNISPAKKRYLDSLYNTYPLRIKDYINKNTGNNIVAAQTYFELVMYYKTTDLQTALYYANLLDNPKYITTKVYSTHKEKGCDGCDYGLIYHPMLYFLKADLYLLLEQNNEYQGYKEKLQKSSKSLYHELLVNEALFHKNKKNFSKAAEISNALYNDTTNQNIIRSKSLFVSALIAYERGELTLASEKFLKIIKEFPQSSDVFMAKEFLKRINIKQ